MAIELISLNREIGNDQAWKSLPITPFPLSEKIGGRILSTLIAERRNARTNPNHQDRLDILAGELSIYEGFLPDPFNRRRRLKISRLIAQIDQGVRTK